MRPIWIPCVAVVAVLLLVVQGPFAPAGSSTPPPPLAGSALHGALRAGTIGGPRAAQNPSVAGTIDLRNDTLRPGSFVPGNGYNPYGIAYDPVHRVLYVANEGTNFVTVVDAVQHRVVGYIPVATQGADSLLVANGSLYVAGYNQHLVQVFNTSTRNLVANVSLGIGPLAFAYDPNHQRVYVTEDTRPYYLTVISAINFTVIGSQLIRQSPGVVVYDPRDDEIFVGDGGNNINVLNGTTLAYVTNLTMGYDPWAGSWDPLNDMVFLAAQQSDNVSEVDPVLNRVIATIPMGGEPNATTLDPTGHWLYVAVGERSNVTKVNATNVTEHISVPIGAGPAGIDFDIATNQGATANFRTNNLTFFNATTGAIEVVVANGITPAGEAVVPTSHELLITDPSSGRLLAWNTTTGQPDWNLTLAGGPGLTAYDPVSGEVFVLSPSGGLIQEVDPRLHRLVRAWGGPFGASGLAVDGRDGYLFAANYTNLSIEVYRLSGGARVAAIPALSPTAMGYCPGTGLVYAVVGGADDALEAIDPTNLSVVAQGGIGLVGTAIACDPFSDLVYVTNERTTNVTVLNATTLAPVGSLPNGRGGAGIAFDPLDAEIAATGGADGTVSLVGSRNDTLVATLAVGYSPGAVAFDAVNETFYVADFGSGTVSVVRPNTAPPQIVGGQLAPAPLFEPVNSTFNVTATTVCTYAVPCPTDTTYEWSAAPATLASSSGTNASRETFVAGPAPGSGQIVLNASFGGATVRLTDPLQVTGPPPPALASASIAPATVTLSVGHAQAFSATALLVGGGPAPPTASYSWSLLPLSIGNLNSTLGSAVQFNATSPGTGTLRVSVYFAGSYVYASASVTVASPAPESVAQIVLTPASPMVRAGTSVTFSAIALDPSGHNVSGLASYRWQLLAPANGSLALAPGYLQSYTAADVNGSDRLSVRATLGSSSAQANATIAIFGATGPGSNGSRTSGGGLSIPPWVWLIPVVAAVGLGALVLRRRRPVEPAPPPTPAPEPGFIDVEGAVVSDVNTSPATFPGEGSADAPASGPTSPGER